MSTPTISLLAGLVHGYTSEKQRLAEEDLKQKGSQQQMMIQYLGHLATNPNVPPEHQQWALGKAQELIQADPTKKLPKIDLGELPPVSVQQPPRQTTPSLAPMTLQPPVAPGGGATPPASGNVGRASDNTVNALGNSGATGANAGAPLMPPVPPNGPANVPNSLVGALDSKGRPTLVPNAPNFDVAPPAPVTIPGRQQATIQNPTPPTEISKGGLHLLTPSDKSAYASAAQGEELNRLKQQFPGKSDEDLLHFAKTGEFPKDDYTLTPGEARYKGGREVARNTAAKPGEKSGYEPVMGLGGPIGVKDVATGGMLSTTQVEANPQAKAVLDQATHEHAAQLKESEAKDQRHAATQAAQQARAFAEQARMLEARQEALSGTTKTMVESAPRVLELSARVRDEIIRQQADLGPLSSRWSEFMSGKIGAPNPEFSKLRTDTGLLQTLLMRMHVGARGGEHMMGHFKEMIDSGKQSPENMTAALDEIDTYAKDVAKEGVNAKEAVAAKAEGRDVKSSADSNSESSPEVASHEVYVEGKLVGHVIGKKYVPLGK